MKTFFYDLHTTNGRWNRQKYIIFTFWYFLIFLIAALLAIIVTQITQDIGSTLFAIIVMFYIFHSVYCNIVWAGKRFHDLGQSAWLVLLLFIPLINIWVYIYILFFPGTPWENSFGPDPLASQDSSTYEWILLK